MILRLMECRAEPRCESRRRYYNRIEVSSRIVPKLYSYVRGYKIRANSASGSSARVIWRPITR